MSPRNQTTPVDTPETAVAAATRAGHPRAPLVDSLRGICLMVMAIGHMGGPAAPWVWQPLGFVSVAEPFFFLSGLVSGASCLRSALAHGDTRRWRPSRRVSRLYRAHLTAVLLAGGGLLAARVAGVGAALEGAWPALFEAPGPTLARAAALVALPSPLDVLPLYMVFLLAVPLIVRQCEAGRWRQVAVVSVGLWAVSQLTLGRLLHWGGRLIPGAQPPGFDVLGWQLVFVAGVIVGWDVVRQGGARRYRLPSPALAGAAALAIGLLLARRIFPDDSLLSQMLVGRPSLSPVRAVNFAALALLAASFSGVLVRWVHARPFALLGRQSLAVFTAHLVLLFWVRPWRADIAAAGVAAELAGTAILLAAMVGVAWWQERPRGT